MAKDYMKKQVIIQAMEWTGENVEELEDFTEDQDNEKWFREFDEYGEQHLYIFTLEGSMKANIGDYIIKGVKGEFYPCKPDIFKLTYNECNGNDDKGNISDGYHTFNELYYHRMILFSVICNQNKLRAWKSQLHYDRTMYEDYFIVGIETDKGQATYHYHMKDWEHFKVLELDRAPEWDGHTSNDVLERLKSL